MAARAAQWRAGVEAERRGSRDGDVPPGSRVTRQVRDDEGFRLRQGVDADRPVERGPGFIEAHAGLEPLPVGGDEGDHGDRRGAGVARQPHEGVERRLRRRVEDAVAIERRQASGVGDVADGTVFAIRDHGSGSSIRGRVARRAAAVSGREPGGRPAMPIPRPDKNEGRWQRTTSPSAVVGVPFT